jgi:hypothetical protein
MEPSNLPTHEVEVVAPTAEDADALVRAFGEADFGAEDWSSIGFVCASCSLSNAHRHDGNESEGTWDPDRVVGLAAPDEIVARLLAEWTNGGAGRRAGEPRHVG